MLFQAYCPKSNARLVGMMLEVFAFPLDKNDVVNSLEETMERKIKDIELLELVKIGIVIRQAEEGLMRTHLTINSHRLATFKDMKTEVTNVKQAQSAVKARSGDAMDVDAVTNGSRGVSKGSGKKQDPEEVCWYCEKKGHRASDCRKKQRDNDSGKSKGSKKGDSKGKSNKEQSKGKCYKCGKTGHMSKECRSKEASEFEAGELAETGCIEMASVDLNALVIGAVQLLEKGHRIPTGIDSFAAVSAFPKSVADDYPMLNMPGKAKSYRPASGKLLPDLGARKVQVKLRDLSLRHVNPRVADTH